MLALSCIIAYLSLLGIAVFVLHSYQLRTACNRPERSIPLMANENNLDLRSIEIDSVYVPTPTRTINLMRKARFFEAC